MAYINKNVPTMGMPSGMNRMDQFPLDMSSVYYDYESMVNYAKNSAIAYVGQPLSLVNEENGTVTLYSIQNTAGTLKKVGSSPIGDESTITVAEDGTVSLYGISGLELERTNDEGEVVKISYQPLLVDGKLTWIEPNTTTVEGLSAEIEGLKGRVSALESVVGKAADGDNEATGLLKAIADNKASIETIEANIGELEENKTIAEMIADAQSAATYDDTEIAGRVTTVEGAIATLNSDSTVEGSIDKKITDSINDFVSKVTNNGTIDTFKELVDYVGTHGGEVTEIISSIETLKTKVGEKTVAAQIEEAITAENLGQYVTNDNFSGIIGRVETLEGLDHHSHENATILAGITEEKVSAWDAAETNIIASVDNTELNVDSDRKLSIVGIAQEKITGLTNADGNATTLAESLDTKVDKVEGSRLITSTEVAKLEKLVMDENGEVDLYGTISAENVVGLSDLLAKKVDAVEGMGLSTNDFTNELLEKLNGIESGAQANDIELIKIAGSESALSIANKTVEIPFAGLETAGVIKLSAEVGMDEDNALEIKSVNVNKLVQTNGEFLILNGGSATI